MSNERAHRHISDSCLMKLILMSDQCNFWEEWKKYSLRWFHLSCSFEELHQYLIAEDSTEHISSHEIYSCKQPTPHGGRRPTQSSRESHCEWGQAYAACCCCLSWWICPKLSSWRPQLRENGEKGGQSSANSFLEHWKYNNEGGIPRAVLPLLSQLQASCSQSQHELGHPSDCYLRIVRLETE